MYKYWRNVSWRSCYTAVAWRWQYKISGEENASEEAAKENRLSAKCAALAASAWRLAAHQRQNAESGVSAKGVSAESICGVKNINNHRKYLIIE